MPGTWWARMGTIIVLTLAAIYALLPTFLGESAQETLSRQANAVSGEVVEEVEAPKGPWWQSLLPESKVNLGLDLQGGIDLSLEVEVYEAVLSTVQRDVQPLLDSAADDGINLAEALRVRGEPALMVRLGEDMKLKDLKSFMQKRYDIYKYETTRSEEEGEFHVFRMTEDQQKYVGDRANEQALETLRSRIDETGVKEPSIVLKKTSEGASRINVQLPGIDNIQQAVSAIGTTAVLEFILVDEDYDMTGFEGKVLAAEETLDPEEFADDRRLSDWMVTSGRIPKDDRLMWEYAKNEETGENERAIPYVLKDEIMLTGDDINDAQVSMNQFNEPYTALEFKPRGGRIFADVTGENVGKRFAIVLDDEVRSAPNIREKISGGRASIEMGAGAYQQLLDEASVLSLVLRTGALPAPVTIVEVRTVGSTLGADSIRAGSIATGIGATLVLCFMLLYYRTAGIVADLSLTLNLLFVMALLATLGATLTLPGIAGIALTVGMAVDANIIVYERIREELRLGKNARAAVDAGYEKALTAVLDANITTFIAGVVLYSYGTGPIKGFAVTLMIGIATTLFSAIFCARTFMDLFTRRASARLAI